MIVCEDFDADHFSTPRPQLLNELFRLTQPLSQLRVPLLSLNEILHLEKIAWPNPRLCSTITNLVEGRIEQRITRWRNRVVLEQHLSIHVYLLVPEEFVPINVHSLLSVPIQHHETEHDLLVGSAVVGDI